MKKILFSIVLASVLTACGSIHTPFDSPTPKKDAAAKAPAPEAAKVETATAPEVKATTIDKTPAVDAASAPAATDAPKAEAAATADAAPVAEATAAADAAPKAEATGADPLNDPASLLAKRSVHFPFDVDAIQESDKATITAHGAYLAGHDDRKITVEGNTDERGSSEYNLALGQRRANNTKKSLVLAGAKAGQIEAISLGEEKPLANGHDEASWAQNRRADIKYK